MSVTSYKVGGVDLRDILNTENHLYYGDITTNYNKTASSITSDIGTIFSLQTFSPVPGTITPSNYTAEINQYNTGALWNGPATFVSGGGTATQLWTSISISTTGQYAIACSFSDIGFPGTIYYSSNFNGPYSL